MKKIVSLLLFLSLMISFAVSVYAVGEEQTSVKPADFDVDSTSAILMEANTGEILYSKNADERLFPASVTKIMTILLVVEGIESGAVSLDELISISPNAASMGGSQVFLKEGETMSVEELLKCAIIASANDAAVALAEHLSGSVENFVSRMNERARELGMKNTNFENVTGLDDTTDKHLTSAYDIALMSRELIKYDVVTKYSSMWQDTIRNGEFTLTNTNRLVRYYDGCNGLKTGSTAKAGYCVSASAKRGDMQLIAVIMDAKTRDVRNKIARELLDYGFASYAVFKKDAETVGKVPVYHGTEDETVVKSMPFSAIVGKSDLKKVELIYELPEYISAPISSGDVVGRVIYKIGEQTIGESELYVEETVDRLGYFDAFLKILSAIVGIY